MPPWFRSCDCAGDAASFESELAKVAAQRIGITDEVKIGRLRTSPPSVSTRAPFAVEHAQMVDQWCEPKAIARGGDDCVGPEAAAVSQHNLSAVDPVDSGND